MSRLAFSELPMADDQSNPGAAPALGHVLRGVGRELADLGRLASELQTVLGPLEYGAGQEPAALYRLQTLDALTQALHGVSDFLHALAPTLPVHWSCDAARAARALTLADLARRLGSPALAGHPPPSGEAGELELFEN